MIINIKPLSVNEAWRGKRFKTPKYKRYERDMMLLLPNLSIPTGKIHLRLRFGFSNAGSDIDNPVKCFVDCLQKKYGFNDKDIYAMDLRKEKVKKGCEFIDFDISPIDD